MIHSYVAKDRWSPNLCKFLTFHDCLLCIGRISHCDLTLFEGLSGVVRLQGSFSDRPQRTPMIRIWLCKEPKSMILRFNEGTGDALVTVTQVEEPPSRNKANPEARPTAGDSLLRGG